MTIKEQDIYNYIEKLGKQAGQQTSIWAVKMPSVFNMAIYGPMATLFNLRYNILNITNNEIIIIGVDGAGNLTPLYIILENNNIQNVKFKKNMTGYDIEIITNNGSLKYRINKFMIGSGFQKANFENTIKILKNFEK